MDFEVLITRPQASRVYWFGKLYESTTSSAEAITNIMCHRIGPAEDWIHP